MTEQPLDKLMDLLATDGTASDVSDEIKNILFTRSAEKIDAMRPEVSATMFAQQEEPEVETEEE
ncbi:MAG: hypothetical protein NWE78_02490 [Candidatus Bathyarchaeota archaeon]|nr:hypothetical protein [Candidatus Bathyarchaeota archaeon]|tara:strand:- start:3211 stop:3402 length:192 start_codon:yes stop_codon:yes gene_type:complete